MAKTRIFLGSSAAAKSQAKALIAALSSEEVEFLPWWDAFTPGHTLLAGLDALRDSVQGAILLFSPESEGIVRGNPVQLPSMNVLFEFGYFYGHFEKNKVAIMKYGDFYLPTDLGGYLHIPGSKFFKRGAVSKISKQTMNEFNKWIVSSGLVAEESQTKPKYQLLFA